MEAVVENKYIDNTWDFEKANTKTLTHCFHNYPAMMIPQVAARLIDQYGNNAKLLFDPYCGTGTSLLEANVKNINAIGTDLNPLARLIAKAKTTPINIQTLDLYLKDFNDWIFSLRFGIKKNNSFIIPKFDNIDFWFTKDVQIKLAILKHYIDHIDLKSIRDFFLVSFSETVRQSSLTRNGEFKLYRISEKNLRSFNPDVYGIIENKLSRNRKGLIELLNAQKYKSTSQIYSFNTVFEIPSKILPSNSVDIVITSPPYGDSRTTVAYGQFSRLANQWLGFKEASKVDKKLMGGKRPVRIEKFGISILDKIIEQIGNKDEKRVKDVYSFYKDYLSSVKNITNVIKKNGFVCFVVGNRRVKSVTLPTDEITSEMFKLNGFQHIETIIRRIPNKRMPSKNSPTNVIGEKDTTMINEYIVVLRKKVD
ncbi:MAG: DNA methyltransferase [Candidatus Lokiarchaeota archaeon]|nr:DNA methyltransferase [Candidatus Lokiarchaeota archaeon]